jgi:hypothetical protein
MDPSVRAAIDQIKYMRWSLLPPYCENLDEDERDAEAYSEYFSRRLQQSLADTLEYRTALQHFRAGDTGAMSRVLQARTNFASTFPFCEDGLPREVDGNLTGFIDHMATVYGEEESRRRLIEDLDEYLSLLKSLERSMKLCDPSA